jgi:glutathionylspermidine amidase/synthetase
MALLKFGDVMGTWRGVSFLSSDYETATSSHREAGWRSYGTYQGARVYLGAKHQCVEGARKALIFAFGHTFDDVRMAYDVFDLPHFHLIVPEAGGRLNYQPVPTVRCANGQMPDTREARAAGAHRPFVGSCLINHPVGFFKHTGHISVVSEIVEYEANKRYGVRIVEQNVHHRHWGGKPYSRELEATVNENSGAFTIMENTRGSAVLGWISPITLSPHVAQPAASAPATPAGAAAAKEEFS